MAACKHKNADGSVLAIKVEARFSLHGTESKAATKWMSARLLGTIGVPPHHPEANQKRRHSASARAKPANRDGGREMSKALTALATTLTTLASSNTGAAGQAKDRVPKFTQRHLFSIAGFCQLSTPSQIPAIWATILRASSKEEARKDLENEINNVLSSFGATEAPKAHVSMADFTDLLALKLGPTSGDLCAENVHEGALSWEGCLPRTNKELMEAKAKETALTNTPDGQMTYELQLELQKKAGKKKAPTVDPSTFLSTCLVYAAKHLTVFGKTSTHARNVFKVRATILAKPQDHRTSICTPEAIVTLQWLIAEDRAGYYSNAKSKDDLLSAIPSFPESNLDVVVNELKRSIVHRPATFPMEWRTAGSPPEQEMTVGEMYGFGSPLPVQPPGPPPNFDEKAGGWHSKVIPEFKPLASKLRQALGDGGHIGVVAACTKMNKKLSELPQQTATVKGNPRKKGLCIKFLLGKCPAGAKCRYIHVDKLPPTVIAEMKPVLEEITAAQIAILASSKKRKAADLGVTSDVHFT